MKQVEEDLKANYLKVASHRGARIETGTRSCLANRIVAVASYRGAWIETSKQFRLISKKTVASYRVWGLKQYIRLC